MQPSDIVFHQCNPITQDVGRMRQERELKAEGDVTIMIVGLQQYHRQSTLTIGQSVVSLLQTTRSVFSHRTAVEKKEMTSLLFFHSLI